MIESTIINKPLPENVNSDEEQKALSALGGQILGVNNALACSQVESNFAIQGSEKNKVPADVVASIEKYTSISEKQGHSLFPALPGTFREFLDCAIAHKLAPARYDYLMELFAAVPEEYKSYAADAISVHVINTVRFPELFKLLYDGFSNDSRLSKDLIERYQWQMIGAIGNLSKSHRHQMLRHIASSATCTPSILNRLAKTLDVDCYAFPYICLNIVAAKMEAFAKKDLDISEVPVSLKEFINTIPENMEYVCRRLDILSSFCQGILLDINKRS